MKLNIKENVDNALLHRKELVGTLEFEGATPKTSDVQNEIAKQTKSESILVAVKVIKNDYSSQTAKFAANVYSNLDEMKKLETVEEPKVEEKPAEEAAPAEAPATEEAKPEEKKEDAPAEEKPAEEAPKKEEEKKEGEA